MTLPHRARPRPRLPHTLPRTRRPAPCTRHRLLLAAAVCIGVAVDLGGCGDDGAPTNSSSDGVSADALAAGPPPAPAAPSDLGEVAAFPAPSAWVKPLPQPVKPSRADAATSKGPESNGTDKPATAKVSTVGPTRRPSAIDITFSRPMPTATTRPGEEVATLTPTTAVTYQWMDAKRLRLTPKAPLRRATRYTIALGDGLSSADGSAVKLAGPTQFETQRPNVTEAPYGSPRYPAGRKPGERVVIRFNQIVTKAALSRALIVRQAGSAAELARGGWPETFELSPVKPTGKSDRPGSAWAITPTTGFLVGTWFAFEISSDLRSEAGALPMKRARKFHVRGPAPLKVSWIGCGDDGCTGTSPWHVTFNNPLNPTKTDCISVSPALDLGAVTVDGRRLSFTPAPRTEGAVYTLTVDERCADRYGSRLAAPDTKELRVVGAPARLRMVSGDGWFPPPAPGQAPVVSVETAHAGALNVRLMQVTRNNLAGFLKENVETYGGLKFPEARAGSGTHAFTIPSPATALTEVPVDLSKATDAGGLGLVMMEVTTQREAWDEPVILSSLMQITDIGLTLKDGSSNLMIWASSIATGEPLGGVKVQLFGAGASVVWEGVTDPDGFATAPARASVKGGAWALVASRSETDLSFIRLDDYGLRIDPWRFNLPMAWDAEANGLAGFVFTERGVYRAGETIHIKGYARIDKDRTLEIPPAELRGVRVNIVDALGEIVESNDLVLGDFGEFDLSVSLPSGPRATMGQYTITVSAMAKDLIGEIHRAFRVEAYRPNRFEVKIGSMEAKDGTLSATVTGRYLHGAPMPGALVRYAATSRLAAFSPKGFSGFTFDDPTDSDDWWSRPERYGRHLGDGEATLDARGDAALTVALGDVAKQSVPVRVTVEASVLDVGAQVVAGRGAVTVHPTDRYVGLNIDGWFFAAGDSVPVAVAGVTPDGGVASGLKGTATLMRREWRSVQKAAAGGGTTWETERVDTVEGREDFIIGPDGRSQLSLRPKAAGSYRVIVEAKDSRGRALKASDRIWVSGGGDAGWSRGDDERLTVIADKARYAVGDTARLMVQSPFGDAPAQAMVTVERRGVLWQMTQPVTGSAPIIEVPITEAMQPNAFVSVVLVRGRLEGDKVGAGRDGGRPTMRIGYAPINVDLDSRRVSVALSADKQTYRPGEPVVARIALTDHTGEPVAGQVTFMAVDEGVLSLTGYRTPNPLDAFYRSQGLAVSTIASRKRLWELLSPTDTGMKSDWGGGGADEGGGADNFRTAFATTAHFDPAVNVGADGIAEVRFTLPDNLGAFRLMAVAVTEGTRFGKAEARIAVNKPVIVRPGLPRFLSSGDTFQARAVVQALTDAGAGELEVLMVASGQAALSAEGADKGVQRLTLKTGESRALTFSARAGAPGVANFKILVRRPGGAAMDAVALDLPVQYPSALSSILSSGQFGGRQAGGSEEAKAGALLARDVAVPDWVSASVGGMTLDLTASRLGELVPSLKYLVHYPYGCVEQTTGATLPLLALNTMLGGFSLPGVDRDEILPMAQAGLDRLLTMQTYEGGLAYWPSGESPHPWGSVYGGWALVTGAETDGLKVNSDDLSAIFGYLDKLVKGKVSVEGYWKHELPAIAPFAAWILAKAGRADIAYHNRAFDERVTLPVFAKALLALAIDTAESRDDTTSLRAKGPAAGGLGADSVGTSAQVNTILDELVAALQIDGRGAIIKPSQGKRYYWSMSSDTRSMALILMALLQARPQDPVIPKLAKGLLDARQQGRWSSTQQNAFAVLALAQYFRATERQDAEFVATVRLGDEVLLTQAFTGGDLKPAWVTIPMEKLAGAGARGRRLTVTRVGDEAPLYWSMRMDYAPKAPERQARAEGFVVDRQYVFAEGPLQGQPIAEGALEAGDLVGVKLSITAPEERRYVALDDPLPAGLEPVNTGFATTAAGDDDMSDDGDSGDDWVFNHSEQRDDRVVLFADRMPPGVYAHTYLARATTAGAFTAPAARAHEMYNPSVFGQSAALDVKVLGK